MWEAIEGALQNPDERVLQGVSAGLDKLNFEEKQRLLQLVVAQAVIEDNRVRMETIIPTGGDGVKRRNPILSHFDRLRIGLSKDE